MSELCMLSELHLNKALILKKYYVITPEGREFFVSWIQSQQVQFLSTMYLPINYLWAPLWKPSPPFPSSAWLSKWPCIKGLQSHKAALPSFCQAWLHLKSSVSIVTNWKKLLCLAVALWKQWVSRNVAKTRVFSLLMTTLSLVSSREEPLMNERGRRLERGEIQNMKEDGLQGKTIFKKKAS